MFKKISYICSNNNNLKKSMASLEQHAESFENNPVGYFKKVILWVIGLSIVLGVIGYGLGWFSEAGDVAQKEFGAKAALKKYEWFKDASAKLEQKKNDIAIYEKKVENLNEQYKGSKRKDWDRTDKETLNQWETELAGVKLSYNSLAAEYNSQSSKFNWAPFKGDIPENYEQYLTK
jgi:hypothetical protein